MGRVGRTITLIAAAMIFAGVASTPDANAGWFRKALSRAKRIAKTAVQKTSSVAKKVVKKAGSTATTAVKKVGSAAQSAVKKVGDLAKSAWSGAQAFGAKAWSGIKSTAAKAWNFTKAAAQAAAAKMKAAAKWVTGKVLAGLLNKAKYYQKKYAGMLAPYKAAFKKMLSDPSTKALLKGIMEKIAKKKVDAKLKSDMKAIAKKLGLGSRWACAPGRRAGQAPCSGCSIGAVSLAINAGVGAIAGVEGYGGFAVGKDGAALFGGWGWSLGAQAEAGADIVLGLGPSVADIEGDGVGFSIAGKYVGGAGFGIDWAGSNALTSVGKGCPAFDIAGGVGVGGGANIGWSHTYSTKK